MTKKPKNALDESKQKIYKPSLVSVYKFIAGARALVMIAAGGAYEHFCKKMPRMRRH